MKKSQAKATSADNLEEKFDRGEEVLDYFDVQNAKPVSPKRSGLFSLVVENPETATSVREKTGNYTKRNETPGRKPKGEFME